MATTGSTAASSRRTVLGNLASNFALPLSAIATGPILAHALGPDERGQLAAVLAPVAFATFLFHVGWAEASTYLVGSRLWSVLRVTVVGVVASVVAGIIGAAGITALAPVLLADQSSSIPLLQASAWLLPVFIADVALRGVHLGRGDFTTVNRARWLSVLSRLVIVGILALVGALSAASAMWVTHLTAAAAFVVVVWPLLTLARQRRRDRVDRGTTGLRSTRLPWRPVLTYGATAWFGSVSVLLLYRLDQVLMTPLTVPAQLGYYAVAVAIAEVPAFGFGAIREFVFHRSTARGAVDSVAQACRIVLLVGVPALAVGLWFVPPALRLAFGQDFAPAGPMAQLLLVASVPAGVATLCAAGMLSVGRPGLMSGMQALVAVANVGLILLLVPRGGGVGAAQASLVAYALLGVVAVTVFCWRSGTPWKDVLVPRRDDIARLRRMITR